MAGRAIRFVVLAAIAPYVFDRLRLVSALIANRPGTIQEIHNFKSHEIKFQDRIRNCEDVLLEEELGVAMISCDPGRDRWNTVMGVFLPPLGGQANTDDGDIWIYNYSTPGLPDSEALKPLTLTNFDTSRDLHPLGIEFDAATSTLYVINHSRLTGSVIDVFQVSLRDASAQYLKTHKHSLISTPNSLLSLGDGKLLVTNDHVMPAATSPLLSKMETFSGISGGSVVYTDIHNPQDTKTLARVPFANGIAKLNSTTVAVASSSTPGFYLYTLNPADHGLTFQKSIRNLAGTDNLSVDSNGKLLVAGHPFVPALMKVATGRAKCDPKGDDEARKACACGSPSWAAEWTEEGGVKEIYQNSGAEFCSSSTFVRDVGRGVGMLSGLYDRGIFVIRE